MLKTIIPLAVLGVMGWSAWLGWQDRHFETADGSALGFPAAFGQALIGTLHLEPVVEKISGRTIEEMLNLPTDRVGADVMDAVDFEKKYNRKSN